MRESFHFADALIGRTRELGQPLCVGLDPHLDRIPALFRRGSMKIGDPETARAVEDFLLALVERLAERVAIVKPQSAFFEQLGPDGQRVLEKVVTRARERALLVLLDAKRGDVGSTADAYARAYLEPGSVIRADALTVNPYLGLDTLEPFASRARSFGRGLFVLVRTSNPGASDLQDLAVSSHGESAGKEPERGEPLFQIVARSLAPLAQELCGPETGWSSLGAVVAATWPKQAEAARAELPSSIFLVPGYGAQGARAADAVRSFVKGPRGLEGGIVSTSRAVMFPPEADTADASVWEKAIDAALDEATSELGDLVTK